MGDMDATPGTEIVTTDCVIVGGGPAGMMLGLLLARRGVRVTVLEQHGDFLRDFRGDTIHPSTQQNLHELGLLDRFLERPHADLPQVTLSFSGRRLVLADFTRLPTKRKAIAFMPQWDFLDLLADAGAALPGFDLRMRTAATAVRREGGRIAGVRAEGQAGAVDIRAKLTVLADGRDSTLRAGAGLVPVGPASGIDVLWFRLPRGEGEEVPFMRAGDGALLSIPRGEYYQCAHIVRKGGWGGDERSLDLMRQRAGVLAPGFRDRMSALTVADVRLLSVRIEHLRRWYREGLLAIGDAAHAMSPVGGVGINLAIQDAVAAANALAPRLASARPTAALLHGIQRRRQWPARVTQAFQRRLETVLIKLAEPGQQVPVPVPLRAVQHLPIARHIMGRFIGLGLRPEHIRPERSAPGRAANR